jgi:hypothetical protein
MSDEAFLSERPTFTVTVTIRGETHTRRWTAARIHQALLQWSDPNDNASRDIEKIEIERYEGPSHAAR